MGYVIVKYGVDWIVALVLLLLLAPVISGLLLLLTIAGQESPIFSQARVGYREQVFTLYKIKTMYSTEVLKQQPWLGSFCRFLRQYSVDEIPQLGNVLKGDMSLVGPRPLLVEYLPLYSNQQKRRHQVRPGITGWAQVHGRNALDWPKRFALDVWYVDNYSLKLDVKILARTLAHLIHPKGVRPEGLTDFEKFRGNSANQ
ncbi:sugar transferase [Tunicatimonas pelagia]|uniref:sugar transferase n=1 Tax=Tunicatimonas pelagia TaxID=931531 RepID=UPI002665AE93|nr:sugar transferase [Tunicatimonas pelagia]WKN41591.1 sugar transferase [Tunicatimonas pelagia]